MPASGSPMTPATSSPRWHGRTDHLQKHTALDYAEEISNPFADPLTPTGSLTPTESQTPRTDRFPSTYLTATGQAPPDAAQAMPNINLSDSQMWSRGLVDLEDPEQENQLPTTTLTPLDTPKLDRDHPLSTDFTTAEKKTATAPQATPDATAAMFDGGPSFCPTRELQMPRTGFCTQLGLLFVALCPLLIVPIFCTLAFIGLWIPEGHRYGHSNNNSNNNPLRLPTVPPAATVTQTQVFTQGQTRGTTTLPTSGIVESTKAVDDPSISLYTSLVQPKGGLGR
ncbi:hypothetical protein GX51_07636 [Blastomyces parvus]|uniref:Transmembrane protein n=1 Tax=Blastomyces parvus TaxID=2060905 RepID=A0A2B7WJX7_9EURO|nr:hypothetical protein GX51_07636 [Blastomyces parvus]